LRGTTLLASGFSGGLSVCLKKRFTALITGVLPGPAYSILSACSSGVISRLANPAPVFSYPGSLLPTPGFLSPSQRFPRS